MRRTILAIGLMAIGYLTPAEQLELAQQAVVLGDAGDEEALSLASAILSHPINEFRPRENQPASHDEQTSFVDSTANFSVCLGGTGSGKSEAAAYRTAKFLITTPPPRPRTPFWIVGETYDLVCGVCWDEKLSKYIPRSMIEGYDWFRPGRNWPFAVMLKPDEHGNSWTIEFKSYSQGRSRMQARSIGGYWFNEEAPLSIVEEVQGRCRDYGSPGWADFTPIHLRDSRWEVAYDNPPAGWQFFHLNTRLNSALAEGWAEGYLASVPEDLRDTRTIGAFASFHGRVFKEWTKGHIVHPEQVPQNCRKVRGLDFGFNNPFVCVWLTVDRDGKWYVYREHYETQKLNEFHARKIHGAETWENHPHYGPTYSDHDAQQRAELSKLGIPCTPARKDILQGLEFMRSLMLKGPDGEPRFYVSTACPNLIREIAGYRWPDPSGREGSQKNAAEAPVDWDNHAIDAVRYAVYTDASHNGSNLSAVARDWRSKPGVPYVRTQSPRRFLNNGR